MYMGRREMKMTFKGSQPKYRYNKISWVKQTPLDSTEQYKLVQAGLELYTL